MKNTAFVFSLIIVAACNSQMEQNSDLTATGVLKYEITKDTVVETQYFPFQSCQLNSGTQVVLRRVPSKMGSVSSIEIASVAINGKTLSPTTDYSPDEPTVSSVDEEDSEWANPIISSSDSSESESAWGDDRPAGSGSGDSLSDILDSISSDDVKSYSMRPSFKLASVPVCKGDERFLTGEQLRIDSDSIKLIVPDIRPETNPVYGGGSGGLDEAPSTGSTGFVFPLASKPTNDWFYGMARFGAGRAGGRVHAASDLYTQVGRPVKAIADGVVLDYYFFYSGTYALVVEHDDGRVVRYGEVASSLTSVGTRVKKGQTIATVGRMYCCNPMLHFEMYDGSRTGLLTQPGANMYNRRADIVNPERFLDKIKNNY